LAERLGVARTTVLGWRASGLIPGNRVADIARACKVPPNRLLAIVRPPRGRRAPILQSAE
jgi:hypothetical protein